MTERIDPEYMVFLSEGHEGIGAVREVLDREIIVYVENAGNFTVPLEAVVAVHDKKVLLDPDTLSPELLDAINKAHDGEDPRLAG